MFEKVNPSHPDKVADRIAGALVDMAYAVERDPKIAVEVMIGHGVCHVDTWRMWDGTDIAPTLSKSNCGGAENAR